MTGSENNDPLVPGGFAANNAGEVIRRALADYGLAT